MYVVHSDGRLVSHPGSGAMFAPLTIGFFDLETGDLHVARGVGVGTEKQVKDNLADHWKWTRADFPLDTSYKYWRPAVVDLFIKQGRLIQPVYPNQWRPPTGAMNTVEWGATKEKDDA